MSVFFLLIKYINFTIQKLKALKNSKQKQKKKQTKSVAYRFPFWCSQSKNYVPIAPGDLVKWKAPHV